MADGEYVLRLEIARLLQKQREMQIREFDSIGMRFLVCGVLDIIDKYHCSR
jgi:hypothetical protein